MIIFSQIKEFVDYWYVGNTEVFWIYVKDTFGSLERELGVLPNIMNWYRPIFQDDDYSGRLIGPVLRTFRIITGVIIYAVLGAVFMLVYLAMFNLPIVILYMIWKNLIWLF